MHTIILLAQPMSRPIPNAMLTDRLLDVIESDILPMTIKGVEQGNKIFGAAMLLKSDLSLVLAETNNELESPLWHGEMHALKRYHELPSNNRPSPDEIIFLSTHEPCSLCMSAITWAGIDNFFYFFSHEDSRDAFEIPHDLKILKEVFNLNPGEYSSSNAFWDSYGLKRLAEKFEDGQTARLKAIDRINKQYEILSNNYLAGKGSNEIPLN